LQEHNSFRQKIKLCNDNPEMNFEYDILDFLVDWLVDHILNVDMKYASYIKNELYINKIDLKQIIKDI